LSRSALAVAGVLFALGVLVWLLSGKSEEPAAPARSVTSPLPVPGPAAASAPAPALPATKGEPARTDAGVPPRITDRAGLIQAIARRGHDGEKLVAAYQEWRVAHGFLGADPLTGITAENAPGQIYAAMDRATLKSLAAGGDLGAIQAYAAGSLPDDPMTAIEYYARASELGSVAAMGEIASILSAYGKPAATDPLRGLRNGEPNRDLRPDAVAWTLAAVRQYGPLAVTPEALEGVDGLVVSPDETLVITTCGRSLAILADLSAANAGRNASTLPPVFLTEKDLYERLPCGNTPAPVMPPRALANCASSPATGDAGKPIELWICEGT
jgi:hypothetical protein